MAVIYVIMVKNTPIRRLFPQKKRRNRAEARSQIVEKNPAKRFFDSLKKTARMSRFFHYFGSLPSLKMRIISRVRLMPSSSAGMLSRWNHSAEDSSVSSRVTLSSPSRSQK